MGDRGNGILEQVQNIKNRGQSSTTTTTTTGSYDYHSTWVDMGATGTTISKAWDYSIAWDYYKAGIDPITQPVESTEIWVNGKNEDKGGFMLLTLGDFSPFVQSITFINNDGLKVGLSLSGTNITLNDPWQPSTTATIASSDIASSDAPF